MPKPKPEPPTFNTSNVLAVRGTAEWAEWLRGLSVHAGAGTAELIDDLLSAYALETGYRPAPPRLPSRKRKAE